MVLNSIGRIRAAETGIFASGLYPLPILILTLTGYLVQANPSCQKYVICFSGELWHIGCCSCPSDSDFRTPAANRVPRYQAAARCDSLLNHVIIIVVYIFLVLATILSTEAAPSALEDIMDGCPLRRHARYWQSPYQ